MLENITKAVKSCKLSNSQIAEASQIPVHFINDLSCNAIAKGTSSYKKQATIDKYLDILNDFFKKFSNDDEYVDEVVDELADTEIEKIKDRRINIIFRKQLREEALIGEFFANVEEQLAETSKLIAKQFTPVHHSCKKDVNLIVMATDWHIGAKFSNQIGEFNLNIAKKRIDEELNKILEIKEAHKPNSCYVTLQGDMISGNIHETLKTTNELNLNQQVIDAYELLVYFIKSLAKHFNKVYVTSVAGNHSRLELKEIALKDERLDDLIFYFLKKSLQSVGNIEIIEPLTNTLSIIKVCGNDYAVCHGDYDKTTDKGIKDTVHFINGLGYYPTAILYGHLHQPFSKCINMTEVVQGGCLPGSGDEYTEQKRLIGRPSQTVLVCNSNGIECIYNIKLK